MAEGRHSIVYRRWLYFESIIHDRIPINVCSKKALDSILRQYGVTLNGNALETKSSIETFAQRKHLFLQAIMRVDAFLSDVCLMT